MEQILKAGITFLYGEKYLPTKRHKKPRVRHMTTCREIEFKKVDFKDFPVAFIVQSLFSVYEGKTLEEFCENRNHEKGDYRMMDIEIRTYGGELYKARRFNDGAAIGTGFCPIDDAINGVRNMGKIMDWYNYKEYAYENTDERYDVEKSVKVDDNLKERIDDLQKQASKYIFSDGKIWEKCEEPMYVINTFGLGHNHGGTAMFIESFYNNNISAKNYFNALQRDEAIAYANKIAEGRGDTDSVGTFGKFDNIIVKMAYFMMQNIQYCKDAVLIPAPGHKGYADYTLKLAKEIAEYTGATVWDGLFCLPHKPLYKNRNENITMFLRGFPPQGTLFFVDNVLSTGKTYKEAQNVVNRKLVPLIYAVDSSVNKICVFPCEMECE